MERDIEKDLIEIECAIKSQREKENIFSMSVLQRCYKLVLALKEYKDLEEQGRLLKLPCKPEDKLYWISDQDEDAEFTYEPIEEVEICNMDYNGYSLQLWFSDKGEKEFPVLEVSTIGKELFYTREEAEAALRAGIDWN